MDYRTINIQAVKSDYHHVSNEDLSDYILPISSANRESFEAQICQRFLRSLREVFSGRMDLKILVSIRNVAQDMNCSEAHVSKILVDYGLRAPRSAFPQSFLKHIDEAMHMKPIMIGAASYSYKDLYDHWRVVEGHGHIKTAYSYAADKTNYM